MASCVVSRNLTVVACFAGKELIQTVEIAPFYKKSAPIFIMQARGLKDL